MGYAYAELALAVAVVVLSLITGQPALLISVVPPLALGIYIALVEQGYL